MDSFFRCNVFFRFFASSVFQKDLSMRFSRPEQISGLIDDQNKKKGIKRKRKNKTKKRSNRFFKRRKKRKKQPKREEWTHPLNDSRADGKYGSNKGDCESYFPWEVTVRGVCPYVCVEDEVLPPA
jgi:hypothetical protein